ncbi:hypothetical protein T440DRAFT_322478 [Plenodomus tracheiphilus IPT5]|uniref:Adhesin domain-containing protein n=1 Tax=Plenodomus tracheiphilus IPT5 TaxID=1408161 RepID=A0A6A7BF16_9PLEO|nr:hypothetical protein T440DRAFT_322478 [Plenodomus tracheiphilus IPT5]
MSKCLQAVLVAITLLIFWTRCFPSGGPQLYMSTPRLSQWTDAVPDSFRYDSQYQKCPSVSATLSWHSGYNISTDSDTLKTWRLHDLSTSAQHRDLRGQISILRGNASQQSDIEVDVVMQSDDGDELQYIAFERTDTSLDMKYIPSDGGCSCIDIKVLVYLRPESKQLLDTLDIRSEQLDIWYFHKLNWEINSLYTHTAHGDLTFEGNGWKDEIVVQNIHASVGTGTMFAYFVAHGNVTLKTDSGAISIFYLPNYGGYYRPDSLTVESQSGEVHIQTSLDYWTAFALTHTTKIHTVSGDIDTQTIHGAYTNISTDTGNIDAYILPFGVPTLETLSEVYTQSNTGDVEFWIEEPWQESLNGTYDSMLNTISEHRVVHGRMALRYPYSWYGSMEGKIDSGELDFDSSALEEFESGDGHVKAKKGTRGESHADVWVGSGELDIRLGL